MIITRTSIATGITRTKEIDITPEQYEQWQSGTPIQIACPELSARDREFVITGMTQGEWDEYIVCDEPQDEMYHFIE